MQIGISCSLAAPAVIDDGPFGPEKVPGLIGWYDATEPSTFSLGAGNQILSISNKVVGNFGISAYTFGGPTYEAANGVMGGRPAAVWPAAANNRGLVLPQDVAVKHLFVVCAFRTGLETLFTEFNSFVIDRYSITTNSLTTPNPSHPNGYHALALGNAGTGDRSQLWSGGRLDKVSINGGAFGPGILPRPKSVLHFSAYSSWEAVVPVGTDMWIGAFGLFNFGFQDRSFRGPIGEILAYNQPLTASNVASVNSYLFDKWGIAA